MTTATENFLAAILFSYPENDEGKNPMDNYRAHDFSPGFIAAAEGFIDAFEESLKKEGINPFNVVSHKEFGIDIYFSLSGHGCGFQEEDYTKEIDDALIKFAGNRWKFEQIDLAEDENGKLDLSFMPQYRKEYRDRLFSFSD